MTIEQIIEKINKENRKETKRFKDLPEYLKPNKFILKYGNNTFSIAYKWDKEKYNIASIIYACHGYNTPIYLNGEYVKVLKGV